MFKTLSLSIALYSLLITPISPLGVVESYNIVDFVNRNFQTDDQSKPNLVKTHYTLSYQSPNILTNIEGAPNSDTQSQVSSLQLQLPKFVITVSSTPQIDGNYSEGIYSEGIQESIYIVEQVKVLTR